MHFQTHPTPHRKQVINQTLDDLQNPPLLRNQTTEKPATAQVSLLQVDDFLSACRQQVKQRKHL